MEIWNDFDLIVNGRFGKKMILTDGVRTKINARLKRFKIEDFKKVHREVAADPWEKRRDHCGAMLIYRSDESFQEWLNREYTTRPIPSVPGKLAAIPGKYAHVGKTLVIGEAKRLRDELSKKE